jgi:hypothetical protein
MTQLLLNDNIQLVVWFAVLPAFIAVALIVFAVHEPSKAAGHGVLRTPINRAGLQRFPAAFWWVTLIGAVFTPARFSEAFLVLRAQQIGLAVTWIPLVMVILALSYLLSAYPVGKYSARVGRHGLLGAGLGLLIIADLLLATRLRGYCSALPCGACTWVLPKVCWPRWWPTVRPPSYAARHLAYSICSVA